MASIAPSSISFSSAQGGPDVSDDSLLRVVLPPARSRVVDALLVCIGRWGLTKTTMEDLAREAGVSRATVYRLFPGGKAEVLEVVVQVELGRLVEQLRFGLAGLGDRRLRLEHALILGARFVLHHEALTFLREHEPVEFSRLVQLHQLDALLSVAGRLLGPELRPVFDSDEQAADVAIWMSRIVVSHLVDPSPALDLTDPVHVREVVAIRLLPGLED